MNTQGWYVQFVEKWESVGQPVIDAKLTIKTIQQGQATAIGPRNNGGVVPLQNIKHYSPGRDIMDRRFNGSPIEARTMELLGIDTVIEVARGIENLGINPLQRAVNDSQLCNPSLNLKTHFVARMEGSTNWVDDSRITRIKCLISCSTDG
ncbi:hypothetical protein BY996DRAFT_6447733 [Phakopsora pachyrhizi]|uniref:Uncharacterized protein n=1 Tax=Phakopsora pachyrhizi TaxID=170000 RepID=A0AAV0AJ64_PHAPC|nr:hypothetical protein BY996DRAFT_6447733 [Phakopsora pachyrhizi]CAH7667391.1 hypothetical protein PPACK8108_LOCUS1781 [Phakopsora pachyrhizi]